MWQYVWLDGIQHCLRSFGGKGVGHKNYPSNICYLDIPPYASRILEFKFVFEILVYFVEDFRYFLPMENGKVSVT